MGIAEVQTHTDGHSANGWLQRAASHTHPPEILRSAFASFPESVTLMETNMSQIQRAEEIRITLLAQLDKTHALHTSTSTEVLTLHALDEKMRDYAIKTLKTTYGHGIEKIKELETSIAAMNSVPFLGTPEQLQAQKRQLRAYKAQRTRHERRISAREGLSPEEQETYSQLQALYPRYAYRHEQQIKKRIALVDSITKRAIDAIRTSEVVRSPSIYRRLDGRSGISYSTPEGARAHDSLFLFWMLPKEALAAKAIVRHETTSLIREGQWNVLGGKEFSDLISLYEFSYGPRFVTEIRTEIAATVARHIRDLEAGRVEIVSRRGKQEAIYPTYDTDMPILRLADVDGMFTLMKSINEYNQSATAGDPSAIGESFTRLTDSIQRQHAIVSVQQRESLAWTLLSIPGLNIDAVADMIHRFGEDEHRSGMGYISRLPMISSRSAKRSSRYAEIVFQAYNRDLFAWPYPPKYEAHSRTIPPEQGYSWTKDPIKRQLTPEGVQNMELSVRAQHMLRLSRRGKNEVLPPMIVKSPTPHSVIEVTSATEQKSLAQSEGPKQPSKEALPPQISRDKQWKSITNAMKRLVDEDTPEIMELFAKATDATHVTGTDVIALLELVFNTLTPEESALFPSGTYDVVRQLAGNFMAHPEAYISPAKRRNKEGKVVPTYVVVYQNPLSASSSFAS